jgi:hypothetical protein
MSSRLVSRSAILTRESCRLINESIAIDDSRRDMRWVLKREHVSPHRSDA